jgi:crossover junction endodeoxyribonuclease RuvC
MRILGLDPGTRVTGFGVVDVEGSRMRLVDAGILATPSDAPLEIRLATIAHRLRDLVAATGPEAAAVEGAFVKLDPKAALAIGHARGAILAVLGELSVPVFSYAPASIKRAVTGNGRASKEQVARMVGAILGSDEPLERDATDALGAAVAHAFGRKAQLLGEQ